MKYIYSPQHQGLVLAPLMTEPNILADEFHNENGLFKKSKYNKHKGAYNTWLSSPPFYKVRPEDIEWFSVERGEDEFEVRKQWLREKANQWLDVDMHLPINYYCKTRIVAIPKKGNEPSHYEKMLEEKYLPELSKSGNESKEQSHEPDFENDPYWIGQAYLQDKQLLEIEKMFDDNGLRLELTCSACPEQYDVFLKVGYLRLRHGEFRVDYPDCGGETIYEAEPNGDGIFNKDERVKYMEEAMKSILKMLNKDKNVKVSDTTGDASSKNAD